MRGNDITMYKSSIARQSHRKVATDYFIISQTIEKDFDELIPRMSSRLYINITNYRDKSLCERGSTQQVFNRDVSFSFMVCPALSSLPVS